MIGKECLPNSLGTNTVESLEEESSQSTSDLAGTQMSLTRFSDSYLRTRIIDTSRPLNYLVHVDIKLLPMKSRKKLQQSRETDVCSRIPNFLTTSLITQVVFLPKNLNDFTEQRTLEIMAQQMDKM